MKIKIFTIICMLALITAAVRAENIKDTYSDKEILPGMTNLILGGGYSTDMANSVAVPQPVMETESCITEGGSSGMIELSHSVEQSAFSFQLGIDIGKIIDLYKKIKDIIDGKKNTFNDSNILKNAYPLFSASSDAKEYLDLLIKNQNYSENLYFMEKIQLATKIVTSFGEDGLTGFGKENYTLGPEKFRKNCGDKYVQQITYGAVLFVAYKINFSSYEYKVDFDKNASEVSSLSFEAVPEWLHSKGYKGSIELSAYQLGGDAQKLGTIFNTNDEDKAFHVEISTIAEAPDYFKGLCESILKYAADDFSQQIGYDRSTGKYIGNVAPVDYVLDDYKNIGLNVGPSVVNDEIKDVREKLEKYLAETEYCSGVIEHIMSSAVYPEISQEDRELLESYDSSLKHDSKLLNEDSETGIIQCYKYPEKSVEIYNNLLGQFSAYYEMDKIKDLVRFYSNAYKLSGSINDEIFYPLRFKNKVYIVSENTSFDKYSYATLNFCGDNSSVTINTDSGKNGIGIDNQELSLKDNNVYEGKIEIKGHLFKKSVKLSGIENPL